MAFSWSWGRWVTCGWESKRDSMTTSMILPHLFLALNYLTGIACIYFVVTLFEVCQQEPVYVSLALLGRIHHFVRRLWDIYSNVVRTSYLPTRMYCCILVSAIVFNGSIPQLRLHPATTAPQTLSICNVRILVVKFELWPIKKPRNRRKNNIKIVCGGFWGRWLDFSGLRGFIWLGSAIASNTLQNSLRRKISLTNRSLC